MTTDALTNPDGLAQVRALLASGRQPPLGEKLGIYLVEAERGHAVFEATPDGTSYNPMGSVHGGYISAILDSACGIAAHTGLKPGLGYTTLELKVSFLRSLNDASGKIRAVGRLISMGGRAAFSEATLFNEKGQICATATSTLLVFELRPAKPAIDIV
ncbi:PaaI family thioesterase [Sphingomonas sp. CFBP 13603]|uniref:PaaI family thioesterase n=1 Tax=Sphingomonas sp. CFBP 13603 TaxID=2774040 RepID=UPI0018673EBD|nr:PaaI family thioesterase [Sphingomonas sp. CFBP 13603]MBE2992647.1 PaaI family thioesterase [Sphingomonas sp. CFBP 13603]